MTTSPPSPPPVRDRGLAVACFLGIVICLLMTAFEFSRAVDGNDRSVAYAFEWPAFAVFIVWMWRKLGTRHDPDDSEPSPPEG